MKNSDLMNISLQDHYYRVHKLKNFGDVEKVHEIRHLFLIILISIAPYRIFETKRLQSNARAHVNTKQQAEHVVRHYEQPQGQRLSALAGLQRRHPNPQRSQAHCTQIRRQRNDHWRWTVNCRPPARRGRTRQLHPGGRIYDPQHSLCNPLVHRTIIVAESPRKRSH